MALSASVKKRIAAIAAEVKARKEAEKSSCDAAKASRRRAMAAKRKPRGGSFGRYVKRKSAERKASALRVSSINELARLAATDPRYEQLAKDAAENLGGGPRETRDLQAAIRWLEMNAMETDERGVVDEINSVAEIMGASRVSARAGLLDAEEGYVDIEVALNFAEAYASLGDAVQQQVRDLLDGESSGDPGMYWDGINPAAVELIERRLGGFFDELDAAISSYNEWDGEDEDLSDEEEFRRSYRENFPRRRRR